MARKLAVLVTALAAGALSRAAFAQPAPPVLFTPATLSIGSRLHGVVSDDDGHAIDGVSVLALGATLGVATSDSFGRFNLVLPPGQYVIRAIRVGYVSTYRELVQIKTNVALERNITLLRAFASMDGEAGPENASGEPDHSHSDMAWRLRHLPRSVLRDVGASPLAPEAADAGGTGTGELGLIEPPAFANRVQPAAPAPAVEPLLARDLSGEVNLLTSGALRAASGGTNTESPHGIAYVAVGAPIAAGDWTLATALAGDALSSWTLAANYTAHADEPHVLHVGLSYGSQTFAALPGAAASVITAAPASRSAGALDVSDDWHADHALDVDYGVRVDRYDYLDRGALASPRGAVRVRVLPRIAVSSSVSSEAIAPGADEFLPPTSSGPWLPPERTFSSLDPASGLDPEIVRRAETGVDYGLTAGSATTLGVHRVSESTAGQLATLFGIDEGSASGHYYVGVPGSVDVDGWVVRLRGPIAPHVHASVDYFNGVADWHDAGAVAALLATAPTVVRLGREHLDDLQMRVDATIPRSATRIVFAYRVTAVDAGAAGTMPLSDGRFDLELRQDLPYRPLHQGSLNLLLTVRTLMRDIGAPTSFYDELLTVAPPTRVTAGVQMWF